MDNPIRTLDHIDGMLSDIHYWMLVLEDSPVKIPENRINFLIGEIKSHTQALYESVEKTAELHQDYLDGVEAMLKQEAKHEDQPDMFKEELK